MTVQDGERVNAAVTNTSFVSKEAVTGNEVTGIIDLNNVTDVNSGAQITNTQEKINENADRVTAVESDVADIRTTQGTSDGDVDMGTYVAGPNSFNLTDNESSKENNQELIDGIDARQLLSEKGVANGYAGLDGSGKVPSSQLPTDLSNYLGAWDASTNLPALANGVGDQGDFYRTSAAGSVDFGAGAESFLVGDMVIYSGAVWEKIPATDLVTSVNTQQGDVVLDSDDVLEGAVNLYYTDVRADARIAAASIDDLIDVDTTTVPPNIDEALKWDGSNWVPGEATGAGGGGLKNFLSQTNSKGEVDLIGDTDWVAFDDGAVSVPVDGTGGVPAVISIDLTVASGEVLEGAKSFEITKTAADGQGEGVSVNLDDIELGFQNGIGYGSFLRDFSDANYAGTVGVWLYNIDDSSIINILEADNLIPNGKGKYEFSFLLPDNSPDVSQLKLILMETDTNTDAYTLRFDDVKASNETLSVKTGIVEYLGQEEWIDSEANCITTVDIYREGSKVRLVGNSDFSGAYAGAAFSITIPSNYKPDTSKYTFANIKSYSIGRATFVDSSSATFNGQTTLIGSSVFRVHTSIVSGSNVRIGNPSPTAPFTWAANDSMTWVAEYEVEAWQGQDFKGLVRNSMLISGQVSNNAGQTISNSTQTKVNFDQIDSDPNFLYDAANDRFIANRRMDIRVDASIAFSSNATGFRQLIIRVNGLDDPIRTKANTVLGSSLTGTLCANVTYNLTLEKDEYIEVFVFQTSGGNLGLSGSPERNYFHITEKPFSQTAIVQQNKVALIWDEKASGSDGGSSIAGVQVRALNSKKDDYGLVDLLGNAWTHNSLGTFKAKGSVPGFQVNRHQSSLRKNSSSIKDGENAFSSSGDATSTRSEVEHIYKVTSLTDSYDLGHYTELVKATDGLGVDVSSGGVENYSTVEITKIGE